MRAHVVENGAVSNTIVVDSLDFLPNLIDADVHGGTIGWLWDGEKLTAPPPPVKTQEQIQTEIVAATQARLDAFARTRGYDDIKSASDYANCSVQKFSVEGIYCRDARAETWNKLYQILAEVQAGTRPMPSEYADISAELPALQWPN